MNKSGFINGMVVLLMTTVFFTTVIADNLQVADISLVIDEVKITGATSGSYDRFGFSVSIDGNRALIGAYKANEPGVADIGEAYIFEYSGVSGWVQTARLLSSDGTAGDFFGISVSLNGNRAVIGANNAGANSTGAVYVFELNEGDWNETQILLPSDNSTNQSFGRSVTQSDDTILVGSNKNPEQGIDSGAVFVYQLLQNGLWLETQKITASDATSDNQFGLKVEIDNDQAVISAPFNDYDGKIDAGAAYVFENTQGFWNETNKLIASDGVSGDHFSSDVAIDGHWIIIGSNLDKHDNISEAGSAYVFNRDTGSWVFTEKLIASNASPSRFGTSVALEDSTVVIGANKHNSSDINTGIAYVFEYANNRWMETEILSPNDLQYDDQFGVSADIKNGIIVIGSYKDDDVNTDAGAAYIFTHDKIYRDGFDPYIPE